MLALHFPWLGSSFPFIIMCGAPVVSSRLQLIYVCLFTGKLSQWPLEVPVVLIFVLSLAVSGRVGGGAQK